MVYKRRGERSSRIVSEGDGAGKQAATEVTVRPVRQAINQQRCQRRYWVNVSALLLAFLIFFPNHSWANNLGVNGGKKAKSAADVTELRLNEFMADNENVVADPDDPIADDRYEDWFELYNKSSTAVDLQNLYLTDDLNNLTKYAITTSITIEPQGYLLFWADNEPEQGPLHTNFSLSRNGDALALVAADGLTIIDSRTFSEQLSNRSEGRLPNGIGEWQPLEQPSPALDNRFVPPTIGYVYHKPTIPQADEIATVKVQIEDSENVATVTLYYGTEAAISNPLPMTVGADGLYTTSIPPQPNGTLIRYYVIAESVNGPSSQMPADAPTQFYQYLVGFTAPTVVINEFMVDSEVSLEDPDEPGTFPDWIELHNPGLSAINLEGLYLTDDFNNPTQFPITSALTIPASGFLVFFADNDPEQGGLHTNFRLSREGEVLGLYATTATAPFEIVPIDTIVFGVQETDLPLARLPDGIGSWMNLRCSTPSLTNLPCGELIYLPVIREVARE